MDKLSIGIGRHAGGEFYHIDLRRNNLYGLVGTCGTANEVTVQTPGGKQVNLVPHGMTVVVEVTKAKLLEIQQSPKNFLMLHGEGKVSIADDSLGHGGLRGNLWFAPDKWEIKHE